MERQRRFNRFDPVTVRAAARLVTMGECGRLAPYEVAHYLRELADMVSAAQRGSHLSLGRLARLRAAFGRTRLYPRPAARRRAVRRERRPALARLDVYDCRCAA